MSQRCGTLAGGVTRPLIVAIALVFVQAASTGAQTAPSGAGRTTAILRPEETAANQLINTGKYRDALVELDRAAAVYRRTGNSLGLARVSLRRSIAHRGLGELDEAARAAAQARAGGASDPAILIQVLTQVALVATDRSDFTGADAALREALPIAKGLDARAQATTLRTLAILEDRRGLSREALEHITQAVSAADRSGDVALRVRTRGGVSTILLSLSRYDAALAAAQESFDIADRAGVPALRAARSSTSRRRTRTSGTSTVRPNLVDHDDRRASKDRQHPVRRDRPEAERRNLVRPW